MNFVLKTPEIPVFGMIFLYNNSMGTIRHFSGGRDSGKKNSIAGDMMRFEIMKGGKLPAAERYKRILKKKFEEHKNAAMLVRKLDKMPKNLGEARQMSKKAEQALKQIAAKKAAKAAKAERMMVIVQPRTFPNGRIVKNGKIYDIAGNIVAQVNVKNGKMTTTTGWALGKYKPKSFFINGVIQEAINKYSPYYIHQRKLQMLQQQEQGGVWGAPAAGGTTRTEEVININHGSGGNSDTFASYGEAAGGPRQNIGATSWGAMSDNVWGTYTDNVWGKSTDNVWGGNSSDIWGGIGGNPFGGGKSMQVWGTGNGVNYLKKVTNFLASLFGIRNQKNVDALRQYRNARNSSSGSRGSTPTTRAPSSTRR